MVAHFREGVRNCLRAADHQALEDLRTLDLLQFFSIDLFHVLLIFSLRGLVKRVCVLDI